MLGAIFCYYGQTNLVLDESKCCSVQTSGWEACHCLLQCKCCCRIALKHSLLFSCVRGPTNSSLYVQEKITHENLIGENHAQKISMLCKDKCLLCRAGCSVQRHRALQASALNSTILHNTAVLAVQLWSSCLQACCRVVAIVLPSCSLVCSNCYWILFPCSCMHWSTAHYQYV